MPRFNLNTRNNKLIKIAVSFSSYEAGHIALCFSTNVNSKQIDAIQQELSKIQNMPITRSGQVLVCTDVVNTRSIVGILVAMGLVDADDRPELGALLQRVEKEIEQRSRLTYAVSDAQTEAMIFVAEVFIDGILEYCNEYEACLKLLNSAFCSNLSEYIKDVRQFIHEKKIDETIFDSIISFWKILHGEANLESTHLRMGGNTLPVLVMQRKKIASYCIMKLKEKFSQQDDATQLLMILGLLIFLDERQSLSPFVDTNLIIRHALTEHQPSQSTRVAFAMHGQFSDVMILVTKAFSEMGILKQKEQPDILRIRQLAHKFQSPVLFSYLEALEKQRKDMVADENNKLLQALKLDNAQMVAEALKDCDDVNQYFGDGLTPLLFALQKCSVPVIDLILQHKPDVNKMNKPGYFAPIDGVIKKSFVKYVGELLEAGVNLFTLCGVISRTKPNVYPPSQELLHVLPIDDALHEIKQKKSSDSLEVMKVLLRYGAGTGYRFDDSCSEILDGMVLIGATIPATCKGSPITTSKDFISRVNPNEYVHWKNIFSQVMSASLYQRSWLVLAEIYLIMLHIDRYLSLNSAALPSCAATLQSPPAAAAAAAAASATTASVPQSQLHGNMFKSLSPQELNVINSNRYKLWKFACEHIKSNDQERKILDALVAKDYNLALRRACAAGNVMVVKAMMNANLIGKLELNFESSSTNGNTAYDWAVQSGNVELVAYLESIGAKKVSTSSVSSAVQPTRK